MANPKLKTRLKPSLKQKSQNFPNSVSNHPISEFAVSELGAFLREKTILPKYTAVLKRKGNKGVTLRDLDSLQLELETLLLVSVKRRKMLLNEHFVMEKDLLKSKDKAKLRKEGYQNASITVIKPGFLQVIIPRSVISKQTLPKKQKLLVNKDKVAKPVAGKEKVTKPVAGKKKSGKITQKVNVDLSQPTSSLELVTATSCKAQTNKLNIKNTPSTCKIQKKKLNNKNNVSPGLAPVLAPAPGGLKKKNSLGEDLGLVAKNILNKSMSKQNLKEVKPKRVIKTGKSGSISNARKRKQATGVKYKGPPKKFWQSINNVCRSVAEPEIKVLEDLLKNQETIERNLQEPLVEGQLYASRWAQSELIEEKVAASETSVPRRATAQMSEEVQSLLKRGEKPIEKERSSRFLEPDLLYSQLLTSLIDGNIIPPAEHKNEFVKVLKSAVEEENLFNLSSMERAIRMDLINAGILSDGNIVRTGTKQETEIEAKITLLRNKLRTITKCNQLELNRVIKLAKLEACKQNLNKQLINKGKEIEKAYQNILVHKKKGEPTGNHIKKALRLVQERETIVSKLENLILV